MFFIDLASFPTGEGIVIFTLSGGLLLGAITCIFYGLVGRFLSFLTHYVTEESQHENMFDSLFGYRIGNDEPLGRIMLFCAPMSLLYTLSYYHPYQMVCLGIFVVVFYLLMRLARGTHRIKRKLTQHIGDKSIHRGG